MRIKVGNRSVGSAEQDIRERNRREAKAKAEEKPTFSPSLSQSGFILLQCPHQGARNLTKAFFPELNTSLSNVASVSSTAPLAAAGEDKATAAAAAIVPAWKSFICTFLTSLFRALLFPTVPFNELKKRDDFLMGRLHCCHLSLSGVIEDAWRAGGEKRKAGTGARNHAGIETLPPLPGTVLYQSFTHAWVRTYFTTSTPVLCTAVVHQARAPTVLARRTENEKTRKRFKDSQLPATPPPSS